MQIVIDIPEEEYRMFQSAVEHSMGNSAMVRILNGTPLPKGHGRLIDADAFVKRSNDYYAKTAYELKAIDIEEEPTIIEAERSEKE